MENRVTPKEADDMTVSLFKAALAPVPTPIDLEEERERWRREAAEEAQRRAEARAWQLTFNRLFPHQAVPV